MPGSNRFSRGTIRNWKCVCRRHAGSKARALRSAGSRSARSRAIRPIAQWVHVDEMFLACQADLTQLMAGTPQIRRLILRRMRIQATCYQEGQWNIAQLLPLPHFGGSVPTIVVEDSVVELKDFCKRPERSMVLREINLKLQAESAADRTKKWRLAGTLLR